MSSPAMYSPSLTQGHTPQYGNGNGDGGGGGVGQSPSGSVVGGPSNWATRGNSTGEVSSVRLQTNNNNTNYSAYTSGMNNNASTTYNNPPGSSGSNGGGASSSTNLSTSGNPQMMLPPQGPSGFPLPLGSAQGLAEAPNAITSRLLPFMTGPAGGLTGGGALQESGIPLSETLRRLARVEDALGLRQQQQQTTLPAPRPVRTNSRPSLDGESDGTTAGGAFASNSADGSMSFRVDRDAISRSTSAGEGTTVDAGRWFATQNTVPNIEALRASNAPISLNLTDCGTPSENLARLIKECGVSPTKLMELVQELPEYSFASKLVDYFFESLNYVRYPIHEQSFRRSFENVYERRLKKMDLEPGNVRILPLVFIVLATSARLAPEEWAGDDRTRRLNSLRMYWCCEWLNELVVMGWSSRLNRSSSCSSSIDPHCHSHPTRIFGVGSDSTIGMS